MINQDKFFNVLDSGKLSPAVRSRWGRAYGLAKTHRRIVLVREEKHKDRTSYLFEIESTSGSEVYQVHLEYDENYKFRTGSCSCPDCQRSWRVALGNTPEHNPFHEEAKNKIVIPTTLFYNIPNYLKKQVESAGYEIKPGATVNTVSTGWGGTPVWRNAPVCKHMFYTMMWLV